MSRSLIRFARTALLAGLATFGVGSVAKADVLTTFTGTAPASTSNTTAFGTTVNGMPVGAFNFANSTSSDPRIGSSFKSFCADYFQPVIASNTYNYSVVSAGDLPDIGGDATKLGRVQELFNRFYNTAVAGNADTGGAFQLALWELLYDGAGTTGLTTGNFTATGGANVTIANNWLSTIDDPNAASPTDNLTLVGLFNATAQDQLTAVPSQVNPIPAPAGVVLVAIGGLVMAARRRFSTKVEATEEAAS
jgi:hypothetical protein